MKTSPFNATAFPESTFTPNTSSHQGNSYTAIKNRRKLFGTGGIGLSKAQERRQAMEERLQANNPEAPQNQPVPPTSDEPFVAQIPNSGGVSNQSGDVGYNTGANYLEQQQLAGTLNPMRRSGNSNVRTSTRRIGGVDIGGRDYGGFEIGEYQQQNGGMAGRTSRMNAERARLSNLRGRFGEDDPYWELMGGGSSLGEVAGAFRGGPNENIDDRQNQFNNLLFNPNVKSDQGLNEQYESFYNTQGIV